MKRTKIRGSATCGYGARKKHQGSGHKGGKGKAGSGKRADQKKTKFVKGPQKGKNKYFGGYGFNSKKKKLKIINLREINEKFGNEEKINLKGYKILGKGEINKKFIIRADSISKSAIEKIKKAGGEVILKKKEIKKKLVKGENNES